MANAFNALVRGVSTSLDLILVKPFSETERLLFAPYIFSISYLSNAFLVAF